ncbi:MAG: ATP synthase F1 subunit epsilon [Chloroflexi bacterium]|jgi:F-type H+-transporting ATPase subunit epsilon|nr:ATP synthase F1 subunit epsilon [Anaerolineaceae bacterium]NMB88904.1 ATP synthase F1 subunit epsilon [Chloroflexota bacterium]
MAIKCDIVSQDRVVYQGEADMVVIPGADGVMGILPKHSPLLTVLKYGIITVRSKQAEEQHFTVAGGFAEVQPDQVTILADAAENIEEIDEQRAEDARHRAEDALSKVTADNKDDQYLLIQAALRRSTLRLDAVRRYRQGRHR